MSESSQGEDTDKNNQHEHVKSPQSFDAAAIQARRFIRRKTMLMQQSKQMRGGFQDPNDPIKKNGESALRNNREEIPPDIFGLGQAKVFEKFDEINLREQCNAHQQLQKELKELKVDKRQRLTNKALREIEKQLLEKYRLEKSVKSFTNEDDVKSKLIYETITRTNDTEYFKYINGIEDKMTNVEAILQYTKDPYSYMLHKNRRLLIKLLALQERKKKEIEEQGKFSQSAGRFSYQAQQKTAQSINNFGKIFMQHHQDMIKAQGLRQKMKLDQSISSPYHVSRRILSNHSQSYRPVTSFGGSTTNLRSSLIGADSIGVENTANKMSTNNIGSTNSKYYKLKSQGPFGETLQGRLSGQDKFEVIKASLLGDKFTRINALSKAFSEYKLA